jgi:uncharacterized membrane protein YqjE
VGILQALLGLITKSAGKILNAIFGWSVRALFGRTSSTEQTFLSGLVGAAIAWPLLVAGVAAPRVAALVLAFVRIPHWIPSWTIRLVWTGLALLVPLAMGIAVTARGSSELAREPALKRLARGFPITIGLATAFLIMFVSVPIMRLAALVRRETSADVPLVTEGDGYHRVAAAIVEALSRQGFALRAARAGWWVSAPTRVLGWFGGDAFRKFVPELFEHYQAPGLAISFYTSGALLRGPASQVTRAHGLVAEAATLTEGLQTQHPAPQELERHIKEVWKVYAVDPRAHAGSARLLARVGELARELASLEVDFDEWQVLYRQLLQLDRALHGGTQLLESTIDEKGEVVMTEKDTNQDRLKVVPPFAKPQPPAGAAAASVAKTQRPPELQAASTPELLSELASQAAALAKKEIELAKVELREDLRQEVTAASRLGIAALAGFLTVNLLLVTAVLALARTMPAWGAGLLASGLTLLLAAAMGMSGWKHIMRAPLERTRRTLKEDARWTKERLA